MVTRVATLATSLVSGAVRSRSPMIVRSAGRASAYGTAVWHDTQNVPRSRAAFGHDIHHSARLSRYVAAARGSHELPFGAVPRTPEAAVESANAPNTAIGRMVNLVITRLSIPVYSGPMRLLIALLSVVTSNGLVRCASRVHHSGASW